MKQAVILAGGLGTRLGDLTSQLPKPLLTIDGIPFIEYLIKNLIRFGFNDILLLFGHMGNAFFIYLSPVILEIVG